MSYFVYTAPPIDFGWENLSTVRETVVRLLEVGPTMDSDDYVFGEARAFLDSWELAKQQAREMGWEGDFKHAPCVFWLPGEDDFEYGFVFKQENNGNTYIVSPQLLSREPSINY